jgi:Root hair defective 3 GTP-binding protein (RHD3)
LNRLFGTSFDIMDESKRQQTTKGELEFCSVWKWSFIVMGRYLDVQGAGDECYGNGC